MPVQITEAASLPRRSGDGGARYRARIIQGNIFGSSGYYSNEVLQEAAHDRVFGAGKPIFFDHPGMAEQEDRPSRSVRDLAGKLVSDAVFESDGLYADVEFYPHVAPIVSAMASDIGLSIRAYADAESGEAAGRTGTIIKRITEAVSVDLVTRAGAGGKLVNLLESAEHGAAEAVQTALTESEPAPEPVAEPQPEAQPVPEPVPAEPVAPQAPAEAPAPTEPAAATADTTNPPGGTVTETPQSGVSESSAPLASRQIYEAQLAAQQLEIARLRAEAQARGVIAEDLSNAIITPLIANRITEEVLADLPMVNRELDVAALRERVANKRDRAEREIGEAAQAMGFGQPRGLGAVSESLGKSEEYQSKQAELFESLGMSTSAAKIAARGE